MALWPVYKYFSSSDIILNQVVNLLLTKEMEILKQFPKSPLSSHNRSHISVNKNSCSIVKDLRF